MTKIADHHVQDRCRSCDSAQLHVLKAFGETPIADRLVDPKAGLDDLRAPLTFVQCAQCGLAQIMETVAPRLLFHENYPYYSSVSKALVAHFRSSAETLIAKHGLDETSRVVEAASNDGTMLRPFMEAGISVLGIDPSDGPVDVARSFGVETMHRFFGLTCARELSAKGQTAHLFLANNVLAHVADTNDFVAGIAEILAPRGVAVLEFPYLIDLVDHCAFDTIYHQHLLYLTLTTLSPILERHGLFLNDVERISVHGGSLRLTIGQSNQASVAVNELLELEVERGVRGPEFFAPMLARMESLRTEFRALCDDYQRRGIAMAGYGAAAKATTLLHHLGIDKSDLACIADKSEWKQGLEMPGTHIPIVKPEDIYNKDIGALVILAWNFANEIMSENKGFSDLGGTFILLLPDFVVTRGAPVRASL